jgi:DNA-directed RNA polymerase specialized sigma24 family protein
MSNTEKSRLEQSTEDFLKSRIDYRAASLAAMFGLDELGKEDLSQQMHAELLCAAKNFDCRRSGYRTFACGVLDNFVRSQMRKRISESNSGVEAVYFDDIYEGFEPVINDPSAGENSREQLTDLSIDIPHLISRLPRRLGTLCRLLKDMSPAQAAEKLNISRTCIYRDIKEIRQYFENNY